MLWPPFGLRFLIKEDQMLLSDSEPAAEQSTWEGQAFIRGSQSLKLSTIAASKEQTC